MGKGRNTGGNAPEAEVSDRANNNEVGLFSKKTGGVCSFPSTMLILKQDENRQKLIVFSFQSGNKAAEKGIFLFVRSGNEAAKMDDFPKRGEIGENCYFSYKTGYISKTFKSA